MSSILLLNYKLQCHQLSATEATNTYYNDNNYGSSIHPLKVYSVSRRYKMVLVALINVCRIDADDADDANDAVDADDADE